MKNNTLCFLFSPLYTISFLFVCCACHMQRVYVKMEIYVRILIFLVKPFDEYTNAKEAGFPSSGAELSTFW
jgi:hypothetical protein